MGASNLHEAGDTGGDIEHHHTGQTDTDDHPQNIMPTPNGPTTASDNGHRHTFTTEKGEHLPPYYKLVFLMKH
jgi:hypothetical protein